MVRPVDPHDLGLGVELLEQRADAGRVELGAGALEQHGAGGLDTQRDCGLSNQLVDVDTHVWEPAAIWETWLDRDYRVAARPQSYFVDRDGILRAIQVGELTDAEFERQYALISGPPGSVAVPSASAGSASAAAPPPAP